MFSVTA